jgi:hypothetical protein
MVGYPNSGNITLTATANGCPNPVYEFWLRPPGSSWGSARSYTPSNTYAWNSTGQTPGVWGFGVHVRDSSNQDAYDAFNGLNLTFTAGCPQLAGIIPYPASPQSVDTSMTIYGTSSGCPNPEFAFWYRSSGGPWTLIRGYGSYYTNWNTSGFMGDTYYVSVWVREQGTAGTTTSSLGNYDANASVQYTLNPKPCTSASMSAYPASPNPASYGTSITFSGSATCPHSYPLYQFWMLYNGTWTVEQSWSTQDWWIWSSYGAPPGTYHFSVWVRDSSSPGVNAGGSLGNYDTYAPLPYTLT